MKITDKNGREWEFEEADTKYRKSVYGCAIHDGKVLLIFDPRSDKWELPGGGIDQGETEKQAMVREIKEETGLDADVSEIKLLKRELGYYKALDLDWVWKTDRNYFQIKIKNPNQPIKILDGDDVTECKWVSVDQLEDYDIDKIDKAAIEIALKH